MFIVTQSGGHTDDSVLRSVMMLTH